MSAHRAKRCRLDSGTDTDESIDEEFLLPSAHKLPISNDIHEAGVSRELRDINSAEQESNEATNDADSLLATCRLRHGLNEDCLCEIFKFLTVYDLIQLCELDVYFQNLIVKWVIGKKLVNFTKMAPCWTTNKIFQVFGKSMHKIKIAEENTLGLFERFLNFIIQYCSAGGLTEVELRFSSPTAAADIMEQAVPFFSKIRKLILNDNYSRVSYKQFLTSISPVATNLTHLTLEGIDVSGPWLLAGGMENLREFRLHASKRRSMTILTADLSQFLTTKRKLELFSYIGGDDIRPIVDTLEHCTKLKTFVDFHLSNPYRREMTSINYEMKTRYNFVRQFFGVTTIGLTSYTQCGSDLYYPLIKMAAKNNVEALKIYINHDMAVILPQPNRMHYSKSEFGHFNRLKSIELQIKSESSDQCELHAEFICEFISKLSNIEKLNVMSEPFLLNINKIIDLAPNLNELCIAQVKMKYLPVEMRKIVKSIRNRRTQQISNNQEDSRPFHLILNEQQWREVRIYKDADTILTTAVEHNACGHTFNLSGA